mgnify:CR=1 FL=1
MSQIDSEYIDIIFSAKDLERLSILTPENLLYVYQKNGWDIQKLLDLYEAGDIPLEYLIALKDNIDFKPYLL